MSNCEFPCVFGIRPGVSTLAEALAALHTAPLVDPTSIQVIQLVNDPNEQSILWHWLHNRQDGSGSIEPSFITLRRGYVTRIDLAVQLQLTDVLDFAGKPLHTFTISGLGGKTGGWYYPQSGAFYLINPGCDQDNPTATIYALQIRMSQDPEPFTDFEYWHGLNAWHKRFCR